MKIVTIVVLVVVALFILLPILSGNAPLPTSMSATEIGHFIGGFAGYWIDALKSVFSAL